MFKFHMLVFFFPKFKIPLKIPANIWVSLQKYIIPAELLPGQESRMFSAMPFANNLTKDSCNARQCNNVHKHNKPQT